MNALTLTLAIISLLVSTFFGYAASVLLLPPSISRRFAWAFAPGIGIGLCSMTFVLFRRPMFTVDVLLLAAAIFSLHRSKRGRDLWPTFAPFSPLGFMLEVLLGIALVTSMLRIDRMPHGGWDGWAIWNTHARFLDRDPNWKRDIIYSFHADYPLLTPAATARLWRYAGEEIPEFGAWLGVLSFLSSIAILGLTLTELRGPALGSLFAIVLLGTPSYLDLSTTQYADVPLSFFILATIALLCLYQEHTDHRGTLILAGFAAGCAAWTKNEGLLFVAVTCFVLLVPSLRVPSKALRRFLPFAAGLAVPLAVVAFFKLTVNARTDLIAYQTDTLGKIMDLGRHRLILKNLGATLPVLGVWAVSPLLPLFGFVLCQGLNRGVVRNFSCVASAAIVALVLFGYYWVYVVTPVGLQLHLDTSLLRLLIHLWPSFLLVLGLLTQKQENESA